MKARHVIAVLAGAGMAAAARAQVFATYSIAFGSPNGPNTVQLDVGQSTAVYVNITHSGSAPSPIIGFGDGGFSITGTGVAGGAGTWGVDSNTASPTYSLPYPWGGQNVGGLGVSVGTPSGNNLNGVIWGYGFLFATIHPFPQNPATVWQGTFTATAAGSLNVAFTGLAPTSVFTLQHTFPPPITALSLPGVGGSITIIPAPAGLALLGLGGLAALRRGRWSSGAIQEVQP